MTDAFANVLTNTVAAADKPDFYARVASQIRVGLAAPAVSAYVLKRGERPILRLQSIPPKAVRQRQVELDAFQRWAYALDPLYQVYSAGLEGGVFSLRELVPEGLETTEFFTAFYDKVYASDEVALLARLPDGSALAMYFVRGPGLSPFDPFEVEQLRSIAPVLIETARLHERLRAAPHTPALIAATLQNALDTFGSSSLTFRERQITKLTLTGTSAAETASRLDIAVGTVKNHRKAIYHKLGVESFGALMTLFLRSASYADGQADPLEICPASALSSHNF